MKINYSQRQNFQASWIKNVKIGELVPNTKMYSPCDVSLVKINPHDKFDLQALDDIANFWEYDKFSVNIYNHADVIYKGKEEPNYRIFAITKQSDNFNKLISDDILGIADLDILSTSDAKIVHIQVEPELVYSLNPKFKGVGSAIIESFKEIFSKIYLKSSLDLSVRNFYKKHKFQNYTNYKTEFVWQKSFENQQ